MRRLPISVISMSILLIITTISVGLAGAQVETTFVKGILSSPNPDAGATITVSIFFRNNSTQTVTIDYVGVHFDWMPTDRLYGYNLSSITPKITVAAGQDYFFPQPINIKIPQTANGVHSFYVGLDGFDASSNLVSFSSAPAEFLINGDGSTVAPTPTNGNGNQQGGIPDVVLYGAIIAVGVVVAILLVIVLTRRKRKPESKPAETAENQSSPSEPEKKPSSGQDFSI